VNSELEAVQFTITDVGSEWKDTASPYQLKHGKKTEKYQSRIGSQAHQGACQAEGRQHLRVSQSKMRTPRGMKTSATAQGAGQGKEGGMKLGLGVKPENSRLGGYT